MTAATIPAILERRAIRKYTSQPVPEDLIQEILAEARWAPSATNTQTTYAYVLSGETLKRLKVDLRAYAESEIPEASDFGPRVPLPPLFQARQDDLFRTRMSFIAAEEAKMGVKPADPPVPPPVAMADIFEAPVVIALAMPNNIGPAYGCFDAGLFAQSLVLVAQARGLGTCITGSSVRYPDLLRKAIPQTGDKLFVVAIALGYPDMDAPVNRFPRTRLSVDEFATFLG
jgi:nitroreductase